MRSAYSVIMLLLALQSVCFSQAKNDLYNQIGVVKGHVFIVNNPELGRTPASGQYFIIQRTDCRQCLVGVSADIDGRYTVHLGVGTYRVFCVDPERDRKDLIRKGQAREFTVRQPPNETEFNLDLEIPQRR